jgi:hypothetical protein
MAALLLKDYFIDNGIMLGYIRKGGFAGGDIP